MPPTEHHVDAGDAVTPDMAASATPTPSSSPSHQPDTSDAGVASVASVAALTALADNLEYTLTVGQVLERIAAAHRKTPSGRSVQRYCIEGRLAAKKIRTVYGSEWLINEISLARLIEAEPIITGDAGDAVTPDMAASATPTPSSSPSHQPDTSDAGDASVASVASMTLPEGERRTIADVLIENARLLAQVEGRDSIIDELKEDRSFLREEVREARKTRDDVKNIAERMLDTLKTMAIGRLAISNTTPQDPVQAAIIDTENPRA
jgi:hypothetical protein